MSADLIHVPFRGGEVLAVDIDGKPHVVLKPFFEALGLDARAQLRKAKGKSWASVVVTTTQVPGDSQAREHATADVRTALMLLATIDERRVADAKRPLLVAYQSEVADVIEAYWTKGGTINPRASVEQLDGLAGDIALARQQAEVIQLFRGVIDPDHLEAKARIILGRALGEVPQIEPDRRPLYVHDFLRSVGLTNNQATSLASPFGKRLKAAYHAATGNWPVKVPAEVGGRVRDIYGYVEADRPIFRAVWDEHYADLFDRDIFGQVGA
ncbi:MAG TPA: phage antirepressor N-terminal domain-containing protein [Rariglobus sp.]